MCDTAQGARSPPTSVKRSTSTKQTPRLSTYCVTSSGGPWIPTVQPWCWPKRFTRTHERGYLQAMSECTAPIEGHKGDSAAAARCPVHGNRGHAAPVAAPAALPVLSPTTPQERIRVTLRDAPDMEELQTYQWKKE